DLVLFVPLAGDQHEIPRFRLADSLRERLAPVHDCERRRAVLSLRRHAVRGYDDAAPDFFDDAFRILAARVVRGDDHEIAQPRGDGTHERPLRAIAIAAAAKNRDHAPGRERTCGLEEFLDASAGFAVSTAHRAAV